MANTVPMQQHDNAISSISTQYLSEHVSVTAWEHGSVTIEDSTDGYDEQGTPRAFIELSASQVRALRDALSTCECPDDAA